MRRRARHASPITPRRRSRVRRPRPHRHSGPHCHLANTAEKEVVSIAATRQPSFMKAVVGVLAVLAAVIVLLVVGLTFFLGSFTTKAFNRVAPRITGTPTTLGTAHLKPWNGVGTLEALRVGNPPGWQSDSLASIGRIHLEVQPSSLLRETIIIDKLLIDEAVFHLETKIVSSNLSDLLKQIERNTGPAPAGAPADATGAARRFAVRHAVLRDARVTLGVGTEAVTVRIPELTLVNLGTPERGLTPGQLAAEATRQIVAAVLGAVARSPGTVGSASGAAAADALKSGVKQLGEGLRGLIGREKPKGP
jgi:hypothetical protein